MLIVSLSLMFFSHIIFQVPFWTALLKQRLPSTLGFASLGLFLYYDLGMVAEVIGLPYDNTWYRAALSPFDGSSIIAIAILTFAPWLFMLGWILASPFVTKSSQQIILKTKIEENRTSFFFILATAICLTCGMVSIYFLKGSSSVWDSRANIGGTLGPFIILLNTPLAILAFWLVQQQSKTFWGRAFTVFLALSSIISTLPIGQRTIVLLPILMIAIFGFKISLPKFVVAGVSLIIAASLILPIFKWQYAVSSNDGNLVVKTIYSDFHRANVLTDNVDVLTSKTTAILPYFGAGYVYTASAFLPRSIAPWKGYSSSIAYTAWREGRDAKNQDWALAITSIDELLLNFGFIGIAGLVFFGAVARLADHFSNRHVSFVIPVRLAIVWFWGYDSSVLFLLYGNMIIVGIFLHWIFVQKASLSHRARGNVLISWYKSDKKLG